MRLHPSRKLDGDDALFVFCEQSLPRWIRAINRAIPAAPRCKLCMRPFGGIGRVLPVGSFSPSRKNPNFCRSCFEQAPVGCREMEIGVLFADVRGYTALSESRPSGEIHCVATTNLSEAQWNFKQGTNRWSVAEVVEHIAAAEDLFMSMIRVKVMKAPARTEAPKESNIRCR